MVFNSLLGRRNRPSVFLGSPEAEAEATGNSRVPLIDVYEDFQNLLPGLSQEKFMIIGRKGSGKSAVGEYVYARSLMEPNLFCQFVRKSECDLETAVQLGENAGLKVDRESLFRWIIYTNILKMFVENPAVTDNKEYVLLRQFLLKNSGYIKINELQIKELIEKHGFDVSIEQLKRFFLAKFNKSIEVKSERAPYFKLLPHLEEVIISLFKSKGNVDNENSYVLFFDDLDIGFSTDNPSSVESIISLIRACRYVNNEIFGKNNIKAKAIILLRDDIEAYLSSRYADSAKLFSSYSSRIDWYQEAYASSQRDENELNLKKFINKRIHFAFKKAKLTCNDIDPWESLVHYATEKSSFKYVVNHTLFRPRDLLLFFLPLDSGEFSFPLGKQEIITLTNRYAEELAKEVKNELSSFYSQVQVETIFRAVGEISRSPQTFDNAVRLVKDNCRDMNEESVLEYMFDRSIIGTSDQNGWFTFRCRQSAASSAPIGLDRSQKIVVQYGIKSYLMNRGYA
jgi:hypothetical protein